MGPHRSRSTAVNANAWGFACTKRRCSPTPLVARSGTIPTALLQPYARSLAHERVSRAGARRQRRADRREARASGACSGTKCPTPANVDEGRAAEVHGEPVAAFLGKRIELGPENRRWNADGIAGGGDS